MILVGRSKSAEIFQDQWGKVNGARDIDRE